MRKKQINRRKYYRIYRQGINPYPSIPVYPRLITIYKKAGNLITHKLVYFCKGSFMYVHEYDYTVERAELHEKFFRYDLREMI